MRTSDTLRPEVKYIPRGSKLHKLIIDNFKRRMRVSKDEQRKSREKAWEEAEDAYTAYMPEAEYDSERKSKRDSGEQDYTTIKVPYSYAMLLTSHTYYTSVFMARDPILQLKGRHGESQDAELGMECLLDYQLSAGENMVPLFVWLMDIGKYGVGILGQYWDKETFNITRSVRQPKTFLGVPIPGSMETVSQVEEVVGYEGTKLFNVRPKDFYSDPSVPILRFQEGEFCAVKDKLVWGRIVAGAVSGKYFNIEHLKKDGGHSSDDSSGEGNFSNPPGRDISVYSVSDDHPSTVDITEFHWTIIPRELGVGANENQEKWVFTIANDSIVIGAQPLGLLHNRYPFDVVPFEIEGYNIYNRSMLEILQPLNETMDWLFNSHFFNVRAALNNMFTADPSRINVKDMERPGPGKLIRLKPAAYGQDVRTMIAQFPVSDVTRSNLSDSDLVGQLAQRVTGVNDNVMGSVNTGGRKTATEIRSSTTFGINRLKTNCEWISSVGFSPLTRKMTMTTQQLYQAEKKFRIVGDQALWMGPYMMVTPDSIAGMYDFVPVDGTMPVDRFAQVNLWQQLMASMARVPGALMGYDLGKIFAFVAQLGGLKNVQRFRMQVVPDAQLAGQAQAGNVVPMRANMNEPGQIPGMGSTG